MYSGTKMPEQLKAVNLVPKVVLFTDHLRSDRTVDIVHDPSTDEYFCVLNDEGLYWTVFKSLMNMIHRENKVKEFYSESEYEDWLNNDN